MQSGGELTEREIQGKNESEQRKKGKPALRRGGRYLASGAVLTVCSNRERRTRRSGSSTTQTVTMRSEKRLSGTVSLSVPEAMAGILLVRRTANYGPASESKERSTCAAQAGAAPIRACTTVGLSLVRK